MAIRRYPYRMHHAWVMDTPIGGLRPIFCQEVTPGDTWRGHSSGILRMAPLERPAFVALSVHIHFFFVPHRLIWPNFEDVITGKSENAFPTVTVTGTGQTLMRAFGLGEPPTSGSYTANALPIRAYNLIYNEFYQFETPVDVNTNTNVQLAHFSARDYFAGMRSTIQQSAEETVDTSGATLGVTAIRDAMHRQKFRERRSQFGERYTDLLASMGLRVPDSRLDRPEHCASARGMLGISEVVATATSTNENTGFYRGHGIAGVRVPFRRRVFLEHGSLIGLMHVRPRNMLRHRIDHQFKLKSRDDLYQQEQVRNTQVPVELDEVRSQSASGQSIIGYTRRDEWLRTARDTVAGDMQADVNGTWTASRGWTSDPSLTDVMQVPKFTRLFQDQTTEALNIFCYFDHRIGKRSLVPRADK